MDEPIQNPNETPRKPDGWELVCAGILSTEFGRKQSDAVSNAVAQLAEQETSPMNWQSRFRARWQSLNLFPRFAFAMAMIIIIAVASWSLLSTMLSFKKPPVVICTMTGAIDAQWAKDSAQPKIGDLLKGGSLHLESGVVELTFLSKAKVAVEGPARIALSGNNTMELRAGKLSAFVPIRAHGFSVKTPYATVVDLGTRFGVNVTGNQSKLDVFEGKVQLTSAAGKNSTLVLTQAMAMTVFASGVMSPAAFSETAYPLPSEVVVDHPANCGFDTVEKALLGGMPTNFGYWSGPAFQISQPLQDVRPVEGSGMLRFLAPPSGGDSEVWQLMDLSAYKAMLAKGDVQLKSSVSFNRISGGENKFVLTVAAFRGRPVNVPALWARRNELAVAIAQKELVADDNPVTWEKAEADSPLPAGADFLIVSMRAVNSSGASSAFPGNFADLIDCTLVEPMHASSTGQ